MPYPPPVPPPTSGVFQGIGRVPEIPPLEGNAGKVLETDGLITEWADIGGSVLPPQMGHAGQFLTTNGTDASWATVAGGGIIAIGAITTPTADGAIISGGNTLQLAAADGTHPGVVSATAQTLGGLKLFPQEAAVTVYDIRQFGAVVNDNTSDVSVPYYQAIAFIQASGNSNPFFDYQLSGVRNGAIYFPEGSWYTSRPLMIPTGIEVFGAGNTHTYINAGIGTAATPSIVQGFSGPVFYSAGLVAPADLATYTATVVAFGAPLNGTSARSLTMSPTMFNIPLHDSYPWSWFLGMMLDTTALCLRFEYKVPTGPMGGGEHSILGCQGPILVYADGHVDRALQVRLYSDGVDYFIRAYLTTCPDWTVGTFNMTTGVQHVLTSAAITINATVNVEIDYDGTNFWLYVNGVHQSHVGATGPVFRQPWEGSCIGVAGMELSQEDAASDGPVDSSLGCIELARIARHTGTSSFTAAPGPYTADSNTMWLCNWDQTDFPIEPGGGTSYLPFLQAQTAITLVANNGPDSQAMSSPNLVPHYLRMSSGVPQLAYASLKNLHIYSQSNTSGLVIFRSAFFIGANLASSFACRAAFKNGDGNSFYSNIYKSYAYAPCDYGFQWYGNVIEPFTLGCPIGVQVVFGGEVVSHFCQPNFTSFVPTLIGPGNSRQSLFRADQCSNDSEGWSYLRQACAMAFFSIGGSLETQENIIAVNNSNGPPVLIFGTMSGTVTMTGDSWQPGAPGNSGFGGTAFNGSPVQFVSNPSGVVAAHVSIVIKNPTGTWGPYSVSPVVQALPYTDTPGTVTIEFPEGQSNQKSLSTGEIVGNNLAGELTILAGYAWGQAQFIVPEPDANYDVLVTYKGFIGVGGGGGGAPATGSTIPGAISNITIDGFIMTTGVDPGGTALLTFSYLVVRNNGGALFFDYLPAFPATISNPLVPKYTNFTPWAIGVTVVPASGHCFVQDGTQVAETIFSLGTTTGDSHWLDVTFNPASSDLTIDFAGVAGGVSGRVQQNPVTFLPDPGPRAKFLSMWHPGSHNIMVCAITPLYGEIYVDGRMYTAFVFTTPWGGFLPSVYLGKLHTGAQTLSRATLRDLKIDINPQNCITLEQDSGPGLMDANLFFGDEWTEGRGSTSASGGWATQIAEGKYGTSYYWFTTNAGITLLTGPGTNGAIVEFWEDWAQYQTLVTAVVLSGWHDLLFDYGTPPSTGKTAAATWAGMLEVLEGALATQQFTPPTTNDFAEALFATNLSSWGGGVTSTVAGVTFGVPYLGSEAASFTSLANAMNADGTVGPLVTATYVAGSGGGFGYVQIVAIAGGTAGNGIPVSAGGGAFWYTGFPAANATFGAHDCVFDINGVSFVANFDTNAATSTNNLVTLITASADPLISGVITAANVANKCVITAVASGIAGNLITTVSNRLHGAYVGLSFNDATSGTMLGGLNGLLNRVPNIVLCTVPPFGTTNVYYTAGKETERQTFNTSIRNWVTANAGAGAILADVDATVKDGPGTSLNAIYDDGNGYLNDAGQTAVYALVNPLVP